MLTKIPQDTLKRYSSLFKNHKYGTNIIYGTLNQNLGFGFVDKLENPEFIFYFPFNNACFVAGNITKISFIDLVKEIKIPTRFVLENNEQVLVLKSLVKKVIELERVDFSSKDLSLEFLQQNIPENLPYEVKFIDNEIGSKIKTEISPEFDTDNLDENIAYCALLNNKIIGLAMSTKNLNYEIDVWVHPDHRRQHIAYVLCLYLLINCLNKGISPHWDAANQPSVILAKKLGFTNPESFIVYKIDPADLLVIEK